ncbi:MAG TPA: NAD(P)H-dependent oxidoreductase [Leptolyngbyaceae cyanobacterium]
MATPKLLAFAGSLRRDSLNKKLIKVAAEGAKNAGAEITYIDLKDYPLPIYDQDLEDESGIPENATKLKELMKTHHGFLIASPEYNGSVTAALKNLIDWVSRPSPGEPPLGLVAFRDKTAVIMAASPGGLGGLRGLGQLRTILEGLGVLVIPDQKAVPGAMKAFDENGQLVDADLQGAIANLGAKLATITAKLSTEL